MEKRKIIKIDENKCTGCGLCVPNCPEGALQIIDGKARLISEIFCDGLGACIGECPEGAITIEEREAEQYNERKAMENIVRKGNNVIKAHLKHLTEHNQTDYYKQAVEYLKEKGIQIPGNKENATACTSNSPGFYSGCPGSKIIDMRSNEEKDRSITDTYESQSQLRQWPVQIMLVPVNAPYFKNADLLISADCVPFSYANFHRDFLKSKILLVGCPKLDDITFYKNKITEILKNNDINSVTVIHMEVPCCSGIVRAVREAAADSGKDIAVNSVEISIKGDIKVE